MRENTAGLVKAVIKSIFHHNPSALMIIISISVFMIMPTVMLNTSRSLLNSVDDSVIKVYGRFDYIYYVEPELLNEKEKNDIKFTEEHTYTGKIHITGIIGADGYVMHAGYMDNAAMQMSGISLTSGRWPQTSGEIAVTESAMPYIESIEQQLHLETPTEVVGVVSDYGRLWPRGKAQNDMQLDNLDVFMTESDMELLKEKTGLNYIIYLIEDDASFAPIDNIYENYNWRNVKLQNGSFDTPQSFMTISGTVCAFLLIGTMIFFNGAIIRRYHTIWMLGTEIKRLRGIYNIELGVYVLIGNAVGILLGMVGTALAIESLSANLGKNIPLSIDAMNIFEMFFINILIVYALGNLMFRLKVNEKIKKRFHHQAWKTGFVRLTFLEYRIMPKNFALALMVIMMSIFFISHINNYVEELGQATAYAGGYAGEMPMDYDFELLAQSLEFAGAKADDLCYLNTYEKNGIPDEDMKIFEGIEEIKNINGYKMTDKILILKDADEFDTYLDISDMHLDGKYTIKGVRGGEIYVKGSDELMRLIGYEANTAIQTEILGLPDNDIVLMNEYVHEGYIDVDKVKSGEEIILIMPSYIYEEWGSGEKKTYGLRFADFDDENAVNDTLFHVGDAITLSEYRVLVNMNAGISENEVAVLIKRNDIVTKIGAIIRCNAAWFDRAFETGIIIPTYRIITSNEAFNIFNIDATYTRVRIYAAENADTDSIRIELNNITDKYPLMMVRDITSQLVNYHELNSLVSMTCNLLKYLVMIFGCINVVLLMLSKTRSNMDNYRIYWINGLCLHEIVLIFVLQMIFMVAVSLMALCLLYRIIIGNLDMLAQPDNLNMTAWYLLIVFVCSIIGSGVMVIKELAR